MACRAGCRWFTCSGGVCGVRSAHFVGVICSIFNLRVIFCVDSVAWDAPLDWRHWTEAWSGDDSSSAWMDCVDTIALMIFVQLLDAPLTLAAGRWILPLEQNIAILPMNKPRNILIPD